MVRQLTAHSSQQTRSLGVWRPRRLRLYQRSEAQALAQSLGLAPGDPAAAAGGQDDADEDSE